MDRTAPTIIDNKYSTILRDENDEAFQFTYTDVLLSLRSSSLYNFLIGSRSKPWDDRDLDILDGFKFFSFLMYTVSMTAFMMVNSWITDLLQILTIARHFLATAAVSFNLGLETFFFLSAFLISYKCFQIMDATGRDLTKKDIMKIYARKFLRLAPTYYGMWFILWGSTARIGHGSLWHQTDSIFSHCKDQWIQTVFMLGNLIPQSMPFTIGCYQ